MQMSRSRRAGTLSWPESTKPLPRGLATARVIWSSYLSARLKRCPTTTRSGGANAGYAQDDKAVEGNKEADSYARAHRAKRDFARLGMTIWLEMFGMPEGMPFHNSALLTTSEQSSPSSSKAPVRERCRGNSRSLDSPSLALRLTRDDTAFGGGTVSADMITL